MNQQNNQILKLLLSISILIVSCIVPSLVPSPASTPVPGAVNTIIAQTAAAASTQTALALPSAINTQTVASTTSNTPTPTPSPTTSFFTSLPTLGLLTPTPTNTQFFPTKTAFATRTPKTGITTFPSASLTSSLTPSLASSPTSSPTATATVKSWVLKEEVFFNPGGESLACPGPMPGPKLQLTISERLRDTYQLCVHGFSLGKQITVELVAPDNRHFVSPDFTVIEEPVKISLWMPIGLPRGPWTAIARLSNSEATSTPASYPQPDENEVKATISIEDFSDPTINVLPNGEINPFQTDPCISFQLNTTVIVRGTNYEPETDFALGIYMPTEIFDPQKGFKLTRVREQIVSTDSQGDFSEPILIGASDLPGEYLVIVPSDPSADVFLATETNNDCYKVQ